VATIQGGFTSWDRTAWAALGRGRQPLGASPASDSPVPFTEWDEIYVPVVHLIGVHLEASIDLRRRLAAAGLRGSGDGPFIIGLAGSVAAGKSTCAHTLAALLSARPDRPVVEVVSTDGFLLPNSVLARRGLLMRKGFPETYDTDLIASVLGALVSGGAGEPIEMPRYSHEVYDIAGPPQLLARPDIVILEGVNALSTEIADFCSLRLYLDVAESDLRRWYVARFATLVAEAETDPTSFFAQWTGLTADEIEALATTVWEGVNLVNLTEHIAPSQARADIVLHLDGEHAATEVTTRNR